MLRAGADGTEWPPTNTATATAAAATAVPTQVRCSRCRREWAAASSDVRNCAGGASVSLTSSMEATTFRSSCESRAGMPLRSVTAARQVAHPPRWASNSRRSVADSDPST
ncbi:hypothetical protein C1Y40_05284 [Mycobacterium talmoniae]|uniref:Uncharacterized protein n=1 Tax=Mycobacterium talmoniae TaxID=1858794 RepID=A0A2S8BD32_9MYCO|nr:hypothetical protein C1Y40_05284 [Mycobacterium talmoniae]